MGSLPMSKSQFPIIGPFGIGKIVTVAKCTVKHGSLARRSFVLVGARSVRAIDRDYTGALVARVVAPSQQAWFQELVGWPYIAEIRIQESGSCRERKSILGTGHFAHFHPTFFCRSEHQNPKWALLSTALPIPPTALA